MKRSQETTEPGKSPAEQLQALLDKGDDTACLQFFAGANEAERRAVAPAAIATYKRFRKTAPVGGKHEAAATTAVLAACTLSELKSLGRRTVPDAKIAFQVLTTRRPEWLSASIDWLIAESAFYWPLARALVRRGLCERPMHENYTLGMIVSIDGWRLGHLHVDEPHKSVAASLRADPELLKHEVWELFRVEGQGEFTLAAHDKFFSKKDADSGWAHALAALSIAGELSRDRLLDESLEALNRGFSQFRVAWFSQFHELLQPTAKERLKRQDKYLALLASPIPPTVTFALDALDEIDKQRPLPASELIESLQPVLLAKHKGTAKRAVQWLDQLAARDAKCQPIAASAAAGALAHESADVQKAAIEVLVRHGLPGDASLKKQVAQAAVGVAASLRKRLDVWLSGGAAEAKTAKPAKPAIQPGGGLAELEKQIASIPSKWAKLAGIPPLLAAGKKGQVEIAALNFGPLDVPRLDPAVALRPVKDLDEWIDVCSHFLEAPEEIDEGERVLEGLSRLCDQSPDGLARELGPLKKRIDKLYHGHCGPFLGLSLRDDVCGIVRAWIAGKTVTAEESKNQHGNVTWNFADKERSVWRGESVAPALRTLSQRSRELAERTALRQARPLLSAATHQGGWLDPLVFAERLLTWDKLVEEPPHFDAILALLRLAPDNRPAALKRIGKLKGEFAAAARYALGEEKPAFGKTAALDSCRRAALWVAAARARNPLAADPLVEKQFSGLGPGSGTSAQYQWRFTPESHTSHTYDGKTYHYVRFRLQVDPKLPKNVDSDLPTVLMNRTPEYELSGESAQVRWHAAIWPAGREAHLVRGTRLLANNVDWSEAEWGNKAYLEALLDANEPLGELARVALCLGLSAKEPGEHTLAADALAAAISDGRVDGQSLAPTLAKLLTTGDIKPGRWAKVFGSVARISPLHAHIVRLTLENTLAAAGKKLADPPKDLHHVLELLIELLAESGAAVTSPGVRDALAQITGSSKAAKAAKGLLAVQAEADAPATEIVQAALQGRIDRAQRWSERVKS